MILFAAKQRYHKDTLFPVVATVGAEVHPSNSFRLNRFGNVIVQFFIESGTSLSKSISLVDLSIRFPCRTLIVLYATVCSFSGGSIVCY